MTDDHEQALIEWVEKGHGFVPLHCASFCFADRPKYVALVGGHFKSHKTGEFTARVVKPDHPAMVGFEPFEAWDETYVHDRLSDDRDVLMVRDDGDHEEPWTWVRTQGRGRVFYTASGHDHRCWRNPGFLNLVERGILWASGRDPSVARSSEDELADESFPIPRLVGPSKDAKPFEYQPAKIAFYPPGPERRGDGSWNQMQLPLDAAESMKHLIVPEGFRVELFAAEPDIGKPITMAWDERGRLWLAETVDYPNELQPSGKGRDRIRICEDTDGDGRADKFTIFAEQLSIPTSIAFSNGGVIVHQPPQTLFLKDNNGDDVADERRVLFEGWITRDTHSGPNNMRYGLDNWFWGTHGYSGFDGTIGGERLTFKQGFHRFRPDASKLEFLRSTSNNTWGLGFSEEGFVFGSTANRNPSMYLPIANRYYESVRGRSADVLGMISDTYLFQAPTEKIRQVDHHGGYTAGAGHALYTARTYPKEYWNRTAFVAEPTGHLVGTFVLTPDGSDFHSTNPFNLLGSNDEWCAPIMAEVGPDGHVWVIDWYNYIVQHNPTPLGFENGPGNAYITDLRDKKHGRVYRVVHEKAPPSKRMTLHGVSPDELVAALAHPNMFWRLHAQRLLVERGERDVVPKLVALIERSAVDEIGLDVGAIHALWALEGLDATTQDDTQVRRSLLTGLRHASAGVRRNAVMVLPKNEWSLRAIDEARLLDDVDAQVRLAVLLTIAEMPAKKDVAEAIVRLFEKPENYGDRWIVDAAMIAAARNDVAFLAAVSAKPQSGGDAAEKFLGVATIVAEHFARGSRAPEICDLLTTFGKARPEATSAIIAGLAKGAPKNSEGKISAKAEQSAVGLFGRLPPTGQGQLIQLLERLGSDALSSKAAEITRSLLTTVNDDHASDADRIAAAKQVVQFRASDAEVAESVLQLVSPRTSSEFAAGLVESLSASDVLSVGGSLADRLSELTPPARAAAIRVLLGRADWTRALLDRLERRQVQWNELSLDQQQALASHPRKPIAQRAKALLASGGALPEADRQKVLDDLLPLAQQKGSADHGKEVFVKQCAKCHLHGTIGNKIGPELTGMAVHPKAELLMHIIDPSRSVEGNYRAYSVATDDGRVFTGLLASESKTSIELIDVEGKKIAIDRDQIDQMLASSRSMMPEGFEKQMSPDDTRDLLEFLTTRGKYVPLPLHRVANVVTTRSMFHTAPDGPDRLIFDNWDAKTFQGVPFSLIDPRGTAVPNAVLLHSTHGTLPPRMPRSVRIACNMPTSAIHFLSGVSGWGYPLGTKGSVSMIVRLHYQDGVTEDHPLRNGEHFADYIRHIDVPGSELAFLLRNQQLRYLAVKPARKTAVREIELIKGSDDTAPIVFSITVEAAE